MSNLIFPSNIAVGWDVLKTPQYSTSTQTSVNGKQARLANQQNPTWKWELTYEYLDGNAGDAGALTTLLGFFMAVKGSFDNFLYLDPTDNSTTNAPIGVGDGVTTALQLKRTLGGGIEDIQAIKGVPVITRNDWQNTVNLVQWSEDATQWNLNQLLVTPNAAVSPAGDTTADFLTKTSVAGSTGAALTTQVGDGINQLTFTIFMLASFNSTQASFGLFDSTSQTWAAATATIVSGPGAASAPSSGPSTVTGLSLTQWTRVKYTLTAAPTAGHNIAPLVYPDSQSSITPGNGNYFWGGQVELSSSASAYVKTTSLAGIGPSLLSNQPRTNLLAGGSSVAIQAAWGHNSGLETYTANSVLAPDNTLTATRIDTGTVANGGTFQSAVALAANGTSDSLSVWLRSLAGTVSVTLTVQRVGALDVASNTVVISTAWKRYSVAHSSTWTGTNALQILITTAAVSQTFFAWGAQLEASAVVTPYISTTTAARTVTDWTLNTNTGVLTMGDTPAVGFTFTATFSFYFRVHFVDDTSDFINFAFKFWANKKITFESDRQ